MQIPRYWAQATGKTAIPPATQPVPLRIWRYSNESLADAERHASEAIRRLVERLGAGQPLPDPYGYGDRPLREEILREIEDHSGERSAVVTRNVYGAVVLNTAGLMFIDVDVPLEPPGAQTLRAVRSFFGRNPPPGPDAQVHDQIAEWIAAHPELAGRWYRTAAGYRLLISSRSFSPISDESRRLMQLVGADPLYIRLCQTQQCFRARLTPKAWRCGSTTPPATYPFLAPEYEVSYRRWEAEYDRHSHAYCTCHLLETFGTGEILPEFLPLVELHDGLTKASQSLPLA
jgi:hypothetical protein